MMSALIFQSLAIAWAMAAARTGSARNLTSASLLSSSSTSTSWPYRCSAQTNATEVAALIDGSSQTLLVTGADGHMGEWIVRACVMANATVILSCKQSKACDASAQATRDVFPDARLHTVAIDLSVFGSVRDGAAKILGLGSVDTIVHNAGCTGCDALTVDGFVGDVQINHLAPALLTDLLEQGMPGKLKKVVAVASGSGYGPFYVAGQRPEAASVNTSVDTVAAWVQNASVLDARSYSFYSLSKFLSIQYAHSLSTASFTSVAVNPGFSRSNTSLPCPSVIKFRPCPQHPSQGAAVVAFAALYSVADMAGKLLDFDTVVGTSPPQWYQQGFNCVPRPLPAWLSETEARQWSDSERAAWGKHVQQFIRRR